MSIEEALAMDGPLPANLVENWEKFLADPFHVAEQEKWKHIGAWEQALDNLFADGWLFPLQRKAEMRQIIRLAQSIQPRTVMDIGSDKGGGVWAWCRCLPTVRNVIACEVRGTPYSALFEAAFPNIKFMWLPVGSQSFQAVDSVRGFTQSLCKIDVLFLDGDKSYYDKDFDAYRPMVNDSGVVLFHDVVDDIPPHRHFYQMVERGYEFRRVIDFSEIDEVEVRERAGLPCRDAYEEFLRHWKRTSMGVGVVWMKGGLR